MWEKKDWRPRFQIRTGFLNVPKLLLAYRTGHWCSMQAAYHQSEHLGLGFVAAGRCELTTSEVETRGMGGRFGEGINGESICKETSEPAVEKNRLVSDFVTIPKGRCLQRFVRFREWNCWQVRGIACAGTSSAYLPNRGAFQKLSKTSQISEPFGSCAFFWLHWAATDRSCWHLLVQRWHGFLWWKRTPLS